MSDMKRIMENWNKFLKEAAGSEPGQTDYVSSAPEEGWKEERMREATGQDPDQTDFVSSAPERTWQQTGGERRTTTKAGRTDKKGRDLPFGKTKTTTTDLTPGTPRTPGSPKLGGGTVGGEWSAADAWAHAQDKTRSGKKPLYPGQETFAGLGQHSMSQSSTSISNKPKSDRLTTTRSRDSDITTMHQPKDSPGRQRIVRSTEKSDTTTSGRGIGHGAAKKSTDTSSRQDFDYQTSGAAKQRWDDAAEAEDKTTGPGVTYERKISASRLKKIIKEELFYRGLLSEATETNE